jgi:hypothetical protein
LASQITKKVKAAPKNGPHSAANRFYGQVEANCGLLLEPSTTVSLWPSTSVTMSVAVDALIPLGHCQGPYDKCVAADPLHVTEVTG